MSNVGMYRSFLSKSFIHICRYGRAYLIQLPCWQYPIIIGPHYLGVIFTIGVILGGSMMNRNAIGSALMKKSLSESSAMSLRTFVFLMTIITIALLVFTASTEPGIVYNKKVLKLIRKEHEKQQRACCSSSSSGMRGSSSHRDEDLENRNGNNHFSKSKSRRAHDNKKHNIIRSEENREDIENRSNRNTTLIEDIDDEEEECSSPSRSTGSRTYESSECASDNSSGDDDESANDDSDSYDEEMSLRGSTNSSSNEMIWRHKNLPYCSICKILTPEEKDIMHCHECGFCIENMDHHCPWMGQCVGKRNMKWFILFNLSWVIFLAEFLYLVFAVL